MNNVVIKEQFLKDVWYKVKNHNGLVMDVILDLAIKFDIDVETAAKIVTSEPELKQLLESQSVELNLVRKRGGKK
jgi:hypothetical protein